jgi:hypothetical protein
LKFRNEIIFDDNQSTLIKEMGNVYLNRNTDFTFEYTIKNISELLLLEEIDLFEIRNFPF